MLNNKQKNFLRKEAMVLSSYFQIGKDGLTANIVDVIDKALEANELVKINLLKTCPTPKNEIAFDLAAACKCDIVQIIGKTIIFYRPSKLKLYQLPR